MTRLPTSTPLDLLRAPPMAFSEAVRRASTWAMAGFVAFFAAALAGTYWWCSAFGSEFQVGSAAIRSALIGGLGGVALFIARSLWLSRSALARAFSILAFAATFSGLLILSIFVARLAIEGVNWIRTVPPALEERNEELLATIGSVEEGRRLQRFRDTFAPEFARLRKEQASEIAEKFPGEKAPQIGSVFLMLDPGPAKEAWQTRVSHVASELEREGQLPLRAAAELERLREEWMAKFTDRLRDHLQENAAALLFTQGTPRGLLLGVQWQTAFLSSQARSMARYHYLRAKVVCDLATTLAEQVTQFEKTYVKDTSSGAVLLRFFTNPPDAVALDAGIMPALIGSVYLGLITALVAVPLGVGAAVYLEEYRAKGWFPALIQTNINNLAGIPAVVYGVFGALVFVEYIFKPLAQIEGFEWIHARNVVGGGLTLSLLTLPVVIVSAQEAIRAVPVSIRHGALALGATRWQVIQHHVLPNALPGIFTGTILAMSRAIGEAAPLVFFGALLYKQDAPTFFSDFTVMPMQIFGWTSKTVGAADYVWQLNTAMASLVLLATLLLLNGFAIFMRQRGQAKMKW